MFMTDINPQVFFAIQVAADVVLCLAVIFILGRVNRELKDESRRSIRKPCLNWTAHPGVPEGHLEPDAGDGGKPKSPPDVSLSIDEKEDRLKRLVKQASSHIDRLDKTSAVLEEALPGKRNGEVIRLADQGFTPAEIADSLGLTEGRSASSSTFPPQK